MATPPSLESGTDAATKIEQTYMSQGADMALQALQTDFQNYLKAPGGMNQIQNEGYQLAQDDPDATGALTAMALGWATKNPQVDLSEDGLNTAVGAFQDYADSTGRGQIGQLMAQTLANQFGNIQGAGPVDDGVDGLDDVGDTITGSDLLDARQNLEAIRLNGGKPIEQAYTPAPKQSEVQKILGDFGIDGT